MNTEELRVAESWLANNGREDGELDLLELFYRLLEKMKQIICAALIGALIMGIYSFVLATPVYEATSTLYVLNPQDSAINLSDLQIGSYLTSDYQQVFETWEVHEMVLQNLQLNYSYTQLDRMLTVQNPSNTRMLNITVSSPNPAEAALLANEYAEVARSYISDTMLTDEPSIMSKALAPVNPVSPNKKINLLLGFLAGGMLMALVVVLRFLLDDKIRTSEDILRCANMPTLAVVPISEDLEWEDRRKSGFAGRKQRLFKDE